MTPILIRILKRLEPKPKHVSVKDAIILGTAYLIRARGIRPFFRSSAKMESRAKRRDGRSAWSVRELESVLGNRGKRSVLVTGVSSQLGLAVVNKFLQEDCRVVGTSRTWGFSEPPFSRNVESFRFIAADLTVDDDVRNLAVRVEEEVEGLDSIIHIAGGASHRGELDALSAESWKEAYDVNVVSLFRIYSEFRFLLEAGQSPSLLTIGSTSSDEPGQWDPHYAAAKSSLKVFSKYLANELGPKGVRVNCLSLGPIRSGAWADGRLMAGQEKAMLDRIPLGRLGEMLEVAEVIWSIDSNSYGWMTGSNIRLDGGKSRHI